MPRISSLMIICLVSVWIFCGGMFSCRGGSDSEYDEDYFEGEIYVDELKSVKNGNTIITSTGMEVELLGVFPGNERAKAFMKNFICEQIHVIEDSNYPQDPIGADKIVGYVVFSDHRCLNHMLIRQEPNVLDITTVEDSLESFKNVGHQPVQVPDLALYIKQRSFMIEVPEGGGVANFGTGFFINDEGLAMTCHHVLNGNHDANGYLFDPTHPDNSSIQTALRRQIKKEDIVWTDEKLDITVFKVTLKAEDSRGYFNLAKKHVPVGTELGTIGNPVSATDILFGSFTPGAVSAYRYSDTNRPLVQYSLGTNRGNSGGAVADKTGSVIAVHAMGDETREGVNFGIDILAVRKALDSRGIIYGGK